MTTSECNFGMSLSDVDDESLDNSTDDPDLSGASADHNTHETNKISHYELENTF